MATWTSVFMLLMVVSILIDPGSTENPAFSDRTRQDEKNNVITERLLEENKFMKSKMEIQERSMQEMERKYTVIINKMQSKLDYLDKKVFDMESDFKSKLELQDMKFTKMEAKYNIKIEAQEKKCETMEAEYKQMVELQEEKFKGMEAKYTSASDEINSKLGSHDAIMKEQHDSYFDNDVDLKEDDLKSDEYKQSALNKELGAPDLGLNQGVATTETGNHRQFPAIQKRLLQSNTQNSIAFSAGITTTLDHLAIGHTVVFDHVYLNEGDGYNGSDGIFVTPTSGLYLLSFTLHCNSKTSYGGFYLKINGGVQGAVFSATDGASTECIPVRLNKGDHVWLSVSHADSHIYGGQAFSRFSAVLIGA